MLGVICAVRLFAWVAGWMVAESLGPEGGILRSYHHGDAVVEGKRDEREHDGCDKEGLGRRVALADTEDGQPEEADAHCC